MPGGWAGDGSDAFAQKNLSAEQVDLQNYTKRILQWRKGCRAVHAGKMMHFLPYENLYVYFRYTDQETVMVVANNHPSEARTVDYKRYKERLEGYQSAVSITTEQNLPDLKAIQVPPKTVLILSLKK